MMEFRFLQLTSIDELADYHACYSCNPDRLHKEQQQVFINMCGCVQRRPVTL